MFRSWFWMYMKNIKGTARRPREIPLRNYRLKKWKQSPAGDQFLNLLPKLFSLVLISSPLQTACSKCPSKAMPNNPTIWLSKILEAFRGLLSNIKEGRLPLEQPPCSTPPPVLQISKTSLLSSQQSNSQDLIRQLNTTSGCNSNKMLIRDLKAFQSKTPGRLRLSLGHLNSNLECLSPYNKIQLISE